MSDKLQGSSQIKPNPAHVKRYWLRLLERLQDDRVDEKLLETITQAADRLTQSSNDVLWIASSFQLALANLLPTHRHQESTSLDEKIIIAASHIAELGLAATSHVQTHPFATQASSIQQARSWVRSQSPRFVQLLVARKDFLHVTRSISLYSTIFADHDPEARPPISSFLSQPSLSHLVAITYQPGSSQLFSEILASHDYLLPLLYPFRLDLVSNLLRAGRNPAEQLRRDGLLIGWDSKSGETGIWIRTRGAEESKDGVDDELELVDKIFVQQALNLLEEEEVHRGDDDEAPTSIFPSQVFTSQPTGANLGGVPYEVLTEFYIEQVESLERDFHLVPLALETANEALSLIRPPPSSEQASSTFLAHHRLEAVRDELQVLSDLRPKGVEDPGSVGYESLQALRQADALEVSIRIARNQSTIDGFTSKSGERLWEKLKPLLNNVKRRSEDLAKGGVSTTSLPPGTVADTVSELIISLLDPKPLRSERGGKALMVLGLIQTIGRDSGSEAKVGNRADVEPAQLARLLISALFSTEEASRNGRDENPSPRVGLASPFEVVVESEKSLTLVLALLKAEQVNKRSPHSTGSIQDLSDDLRRVLSLSRSSGTLAELDAREIFTRLFDSGKRGSEQGLVRLLESAKECLKEISRLSKLLMQGFAGGVGEGGLEVANELGLGWVLVVHGGRTSSSAEDEMDKTRREAQQRSGLVKFVEAFGLTHGRSETSFSAQSRRINSWIDLIQSLASTEERSTFDLLSSKLILQTCLSGLLKSGDLETARAIFREGFVSNHLSESEREQMILEVSNHFYDRAQVASVRSGEMKLAKEVLELTTTGGSQTKSSFRVKQQESFIEATCRLCSFRIPSNRSNHRTSLSPVEVRSTKDKMELVARLISCREDVYKNPELVLDIAVKLCSAPDVVVGESLVEGGVPTTCGSSEGGPSLSPSQKTMIEMRTLAMLSDAATSNGDFSHSLSFCQRLIHLISNLRRRVQALENSSSSSSSTTEQPNQSELIQTQRRTLEQARDLGWKTCYQLSKHPGWEETPSKLTLMSHVLSLCPEDRLANLLKNWNRLDRQLNEEVGQGKFQNQDPNSSSSYLPYFSSSSSVLIGTAATTLGAGLAGLGANAASFLPLSFSPLSFLNSNPSSQAPGEEASQAPPRLGQVPSQQPHQGGGTLGFASILGGVGSRVPSLASRIRISNDSNQNSSQSKSNLEEEEEREKEKQRSAASLFDFDGHSGPSSNPSYQPLGYSVVTGEASDKAIKAASRAARSLLGSWKVNRNQVTSVEKPNPDPLQGGSTFSLSRGVGWLIGDQGESVDKPLPPASNERS